MIIYRALNLITGKCYVGQTRYSLEDRKVGHFDFSGGNLTYFQNSIRKHGKDSFVWEILENVDTIEMLNVRERYWIAYYNCLAPNGYNLTSGGDSNPMDYPGARKKVRAWKLSHPFSEEHIKHIREAHKKLIGRKYPERSPEMIENIRKAALEAWERRRKGIGASIIRPPMSEETKRKISIGNSGKHKTEEQKLHLSNCLKGRTPSEEVKAKIRAANLGRVCSEETRIKISAAHKKRREQKLQLTANSR